MNLTSTAFHTNGMIPRRYTCQGDDINPRFDIIEPPPFTRSFALFMHDHDAPSGDFAHWLVWNIDPTIRTIPEATTPVGAVEGSNDLGSIGWSGPCPPQDGAHRYEFHLYALDTMLTLSQGSEKEAFHAEIYGHILAEASLVGLYARINGVVS